jgi:hypothetical protein
MKRRNIFKALTGLFAAKSLPAAPVKVPASLQVAKAAAAASPVFYCKVVGKDGRMSLFSYAATPDNRVTLNRVG